MITNFLFRSSKTYSPKTQRDKSKSFAATTTNVEPNKLKNSVKSPRKKDKIKSKEKKKDPVPVSPKRTFGAMTLFSKKLTKEESQVSKSKLDLRVIFICCDYFEQHKDTDGLFRKAGSAIEKRRLLLEFNNPEKLRLSDEYCHDVADTFKQWLRDLSTPIFPAELYDDCINTLMQYQESEDVVVLERLFEKLYHIPDNYIALHRILQLLKLLADNSSVNQMTAENLSIIFGPTLIPPPPSPGQDPAMAMLSSKDKSTRFLFILLENYDKLIKE
jgi:hypothetical protein